MAAVQFVIKTGDIKIPEQKAEEAEEAPESDFWQRVGDLFHWNK